MAIVLWVLAILTNWTAVQRTWYTHKETDRLEEGPEVGVGGESHPEAGSRGPEAGSGGEESVEGKLSAKASLQT
jgi:hypothetical protein